MKFEMIFLSFFICIFGNANAQIIKNVGKKLEKKVEQKANQRIDRKIDQTIDKSLDKLEQTPNKNNNPKQKTASSKNNKPNVEENAKNTFNKLSSTNDSSIKLDTTPSLKRYTKYTFIPGEKIIAFDDFTQDEVGDLPASWVSVGSSQIVKFNHLPGHWVWFNKTKGNFVPEYLKDFPENFTLEFDIMYDFEFGKYSHARHLSIVFSDIQNPESKLDWNGEPGYFFLQTLAPNYFSIEFDGRGANGGPFITARKAVTNNKSLNFSSSVPVKHIINSANKHTPIHISISRTSRRLQVFANEEKVLDLTNAFEKDTKLSSARFFVWNFTETDNYYISNIRYANGKPDTRNKLLSTGTFTTTAITFNTNSSQIIPTSYSILKEIADALKTNPSKSLLIVGHTDNEGSEEHNLKLSEKRADAVRLALQIEFNVINPISIEGKGESNPIADNQTSSGKAQNRRVEFKLK